MSAPAVRKRFPILVPLAKSSDNNVVISLRPLSFEDAPSLAKARNNYKVWINNTDRQPFPFQERDAVSMIEWCLKLANRAPFRHRVLAVCVNDVAIGCMSMFLNDDPNTCEHRSGEIGYWIDEDWWGRGIATAALIAFVEYVWQAFPDVLRLAGKVYGWNLPSQRVLQKAGFAFESREQGMVFKNGRLTDLVGFGLMRPQRWWSHADAALFADYAAASVHQWQSDAPSKPERAEPSDPNVPVDAVSIAEECSSLSSRDEDHASVSLSGEPVDSLPVKPVSSGYLADSSANMASSAQQFNSGA